MPFLESPTMCLCYVHISDCFPSASSTVGTEGAAPNLVYVRKYCHAHIPSRIYMHGTVHTSVLKFSLKPPEARRLYESWRLLAYNCIILCNSLGPRKMVTYIDLHHFMNLSGAPEKSDIETRIIERTFCKINYIIEQL